MSKKKKIRIEMFLSASEVDVLWDAIHAARSSGKRPILTQSVARKYIEAKHTGVKENKKEAEAAKHHNPCNQSASINPFRY